MKNRCLSNQDLILLYYDELVDETVRQHLSGCDHCAKSYAALDHELSCLPKLDYDSNPVTAARMAARVTEQLQQPRRRWQPLLTATASFAVMVAIILLWVPQTTRLPQVINSETPQALTADYDEDMPDIDFLEDMDLLQNLDLIAQVEGV